MSVVGSAEIIVDAVTAGFKKQIQQAFRDARPIAATEGDRYGRDFGNRFRVALKGAVRDSLRENRKWIKDEGERQGKLFAGAMSSSIGKILGDSIADAVSHGLQRASDEADAIAERIRNSGGGGPAPSGGDDAAQRLAERAAAAQLTLDIREKALEIKRQAVELRAQQLADTQADRADKVARAQDAIDQKALERLQKLADAQDAIDQKARDRAQRLADAQDAIDQRATARQNADDQRALARAQKLADDLQAIRDKADARAEAAEAAFQAKLDRRRRSRVDSRNARESRAGGGAGIFSSITAEAAQANQAMTMLYGIGNMVMTGLVGLIGAIVALGAALISLSAAASVAAGSLVVLPALLGGLVQGAVTGITAFRGVGAAISAGFKASEGAAAKGGKAGINAARAVADARKALARAYEDAARRMRDADQRVAEAEDDVVEAQNKARIAQEALTGARERAAETLQQLAFDVEGAALSEESAVLRLQRATEELARVTSNPASTAQEIQEASLNYREAELALRRAQDAYEDIQKEQEKADAAGVEGSAEVVDAKNAIIDANNNVIESQRRLQDAEEARADAAVQSARAIADAQERLSEALQDQGAAASGAASGVDAYRAALDKLSPDARAFVEYIVSLQDEFAKLKAAAGEQLFAGLTVSLKRVVEGFFPALENMLRVTGGAIERFANSVSLVVASAGFAERFTTIAEDNAKNIAKFGDIVASVIDGISGVLVAAGPITSQFTDYLREQADTFQRYATSGAGMSEMAAYFQRAADMAGQLARIFGNLWEGLRNIGSAATPAGEALITTIERATERWAAFTGTIARKNELADYFDQANRNAVAVAGLLKNIGDIFAGLGDNPQIAAAANLLNRQFVPSLQKVLDASDGAIYSFAQFTVSVGHLFEAFADSGALTLFFETLSSIVDLLNSVFGSALGQMILAVLAPIIAVSKAIGLLLIPIKFFISSIVGATATWTTLVGAVGAGTGRMMSSLAQLATGAAIVGVNMAGAASSAGFGPKVSAAFGGIAAGARVAVAGVSALGKAMWGLIGGPAGAILLAITAIMAVFTHFKKKAEEARQATADFADTLDETTGALTTESFELFASTISDKTVKALEEAGIGMDEFMGYVADGEQGMADLRQRLEDAGWETTRIDATMQLAAGTQRKWNSTVDGATDIWEKDKRNKEASAKAMDGYRAKTVLARAATLDMNEGLELQRQLVGKVNDQWKKAVDAFSYLDEAAIKQQETTIRTAEAMDRLSGSVAEAREALGLKEGADVSSAVAVENNIEKLNLQSEAGRSVMSATIDFMKAIDGQMRASIEAGTSVEEASAKYEQQRQAFIDAAGAAGISEDAVRDYIETIEQTPSEKKTRFLAIIEEETLKQMVQGLDAASQQRVALYLAEDDDVTLADVEEAMDAVAEDRVAKYLPEEDKDTYFKLKGKLNELKYDENGKLRDVTLMTEADKKAIADTEAALSALAGKSRVALLEVKPWMAPKIIYYDADKQGGPLAAVGQVRFAAAGGPVVGPGGPTADRAGLFALSDGEYVLSARAVRRMGGLTAVDKLHKAASGRSGSGSGRLLASGGPVTADALRELSGGTDGGTARWEREMLQYLRKQQDQQGGMTVSIGQINAPAPQIAAQEVVAELRAESYRMGGYR